MVTGSSLTIKIYICGTCTVISTVCTENVQHDINDDGHMGRACAKNRREKVKYGEFSDQGGLRGEEEERDSRDGGWTRRDGEIRG